MPSGTSLNLPRKISYTNSFCRSPIPKPTPTSKDISKRDDDFLATLWTPIPNKVAVGGAKLFPYGQQDKFTTAEFYGCTVVIIVDGHNTFIGHFNQQSGNCADVLISSSVTKSTILDKIDQELAGHDFQNTAKAWIIASTPNAQNAPGYKDLITHLATYEVDESNIIFKPYVALSAMGGFPGKAKGKAVVTRDENPGRTSTVKLYIQANDPTWTQNYNSQCNPAKRKRDGGSCDLAPSGSTTTGPATAGPAGSTPSCEYVGPSPPESPAAQCVCDGTSNLPLTTLSTQLAPESSCAWSTTPGAISTTDSAPLGPPTTDSKACQICTPFAANENNCSPMTSCVKEVAQATVQAGSSPVHVGTLTSSALSSAISSAINQACPSVTGTSATACQTDGVDVDHVDYKDFEGVINHSGIVTDKVQSSSYNDSGIRKAMIDSAAATAMTGAAGKNCYQDTPITEVLKRSLIARALSYIPAPIVPNALLHRAAGGGGPITEHVTWCNTVSFAGIQYFGEYARLADALAPTDYLDVGWTFHEDSGDEFDCEFLGGLVDSLAVIAPEFTVEDVALGEEIEATCQAAMAIAGEGSKAKRAAVELGSLTVVRRELEGVEEPRPKPRKFRG